MGYAVSGSSVTSSFSNFYDSPLINTKNHSSTLNISNMKGIDLRKTTKSKTMNAQLV